MFSFRELLLKSGLQKDKYFSLNSGKNLVVPIGLNDFNKPQYIVLGKDASNHVLVSGCVGSGKSQLMHVIITAATLAHSPHEIQLYIVDLKEGSEYHQYEKHPLPHIRMVAAGVEREEGCAVIQLAEDELSIRSEIFYRHGIRDLYEYSQTDLPKLPRMIIIVDEFQMFFSIDDNIASEANQILERLICQGRVLGIHVLLCSQTLTGPSILTRSILDQITLRIAFSSNHLESRTILAEGNDAATYLSKPGEAIYNADGGLVEGNKHFQVAYISFEESLNYLEEISALSK